MTALVVAENLVKLFPSKSRHDTVHAVNGVSLTLEEGITFGLVGESGSGKSTLGRCLLRLTKPTSGSIVYDGIDITRESASGLRVHRKAMQIVFQDPYESFNRRMKIGRVLDEPLRLHTRLAEHERRNKVRAALSMVKLSESMAERYPRELSGGELQRIGIARALILAPTFLVLDEPTSSLDLSVRGEILDLLSKFKQQFNLTYLLISHDLGTIAKYCDSVAVMYLGRVVEQGPADDVFNRPQHPYTQALLAAALPADPRRHPNRIVLRGEQPSPVNLPRGCGFISRCPLARQECADAPPAPRFVTAYHSACCIRVDDDTNRIFGRSSGPAVAGPSGASAEGA